MLKKLTLVGVGIVVTILTLTVLMVLPLRWLNPTTTAFIMGDTNVKTFSPAKKWTPYEQVSPNLFLAIISSEDQKFFEHHGLDIEAIKMALAEDRGRVRGASTITQQLAKNLYLWSGRSLFRKGVEAWMTLAIELMLPKQRILEIYVNVVEFGSGIYGVATASEQFYGKSPAALTRIESSLLAAVLPNPKKLKADNPSQFVWQRAEDIRRWIPDLSMLYAEELGLN